MNKNVIFIIVIISAIIVSAGVFGYLSLRGGNGPKTGLVTILHPQTVVDTPLKSETDDWKTYRNEQYGFEVRYPGNWRVNTPEVQEGDFIQIDNYLTDKEGGEKTVQILIYKDNPMSENGFDVADFNYQIDNLPTKTYYFLPNRDISLDDTGPQPTPLVVIRMEKNNKFYRFLLFNTEKIGGVYNQILSTFKFVK